MYVGILPYTCSTSTLVIILYCQGIGTNNINYQWTYYEFILYTRNDKMLHLTAPDNHNNCKYLLHS